jgi:hypothetical protein
VTIFLDIDEVLAEYGKLRHDRIAHLNYIIREARDFDPRIVFNTAWNSHTLDEMCVMMTANGFEYPEVLIGQTAGCQGGGILARQWLRDNRAVGKPYIAIDDSSHYQESMGRLVQCTDPLVGLTGEIADQALDMIRGGILDPETEVRRAEDRFTNEHLRLLHRTPWLTQEEREASLRANLETMNRVVKMKPNEFMRAACLKE